MNTNRNCDDSENLPPVTQSRYGRLQNAIQTQWAGLENISLLKWSVTNQQWELWFDPDPVTGVGRPPDETENLPPVSPLRYQRLDTCVSVQWAGLDTMCAVKWQGTEWGMWMDPEP